eukprot:GHRQ01020005.1.p1 GENE.GHRQ01020005.1~~GHRQ01020005.1.p1  ORF type:complete len:310 (+),score=87.36 GHRQ01020005.1:1110-2039(+)
MGHGEQRVGRRGWRAPLLCLLLAAALSAGAAQYADEPEERSAQQAPLPATAAAANPIAAGGAATQRAAGSATQAPNALYTPMTRVPVQGGMQQQQQPAEQPVLRTQVLSQGRISRRNRNRDQRGRTSNTNTAVPRSTQEAAPPATTLPPQSTPAPAPAVVKTASVPEAVPMAVAANVDGPPFTVDMDARAAQLSPSVLLMGYFDWQIIPDANGKPWSRCLDMVWRARRLARGNKLNFVPTHHWIPGEDGFGIDHYCYMYKDASDSMLCGEWTQAKIDEFEKSMTYCFAEAYRNGFTPYVRPHLDDGYVR